MRTLLAIIAALAACACPFLLPFGPALSVSAFTIFVIAGTGSAVLENQIEAVRQAKRQTIALELIAQRLVPPAPARPASSADPRLPVRIPGINA